MTQRPASQTFTLGHLNGVADGLRLLVDECDQLRHGFIVRQEFWSEGSEAAADAAGAFIPRILDALGAVNMGLAVALDSADLLAVTGKGAAAGEPTNVWAPVSVARSAIETLAIPFWLMEPGITTLARSARALALRRSELSSQIALSDEPESRNRAVARRGHVDDLAREIGLQKSNHRGRDAEFRTGFGGESVPRRGQLVAALLGERASYSILSAVAHGEFWATQQWGFVRDAEAAQVPGFAAMKKQPPAIGLVYVLERTFHALATCASREAHYRGWEPGRMDELVSRSRKVAFARRL